MSILQGKLVVLGVSGGIAVYKSCELVRLLSKAGATVQVIMTEVAAQMVGPLTFQALTGRPVEVGHGGRLASAGMDHIDLGRDADCIVVAPCTANTMAKITHGIADNLLTSTVLASTCPVVVAPAMNTRMWQNSMTRKNADVLRADDRFVLVGPDEGDLACGEQGPGRMSQPEEILTEVQRIVSPWDLKDKKVLVTAGPTREAIDPVRFLSNRSSGKMGFSIAHAAYCMGARVVLVSGPTCLNPPFGVEVIRVESAAEMAKAVEAQAGSAHVIIMAAAVADFRPSKKSTVKLKKGKDGLPTSWTRTKDILASLGRRYKGKKKRPLLVGFAAETGDPVPSAKKKLKAKGLDLVVANDVSQADAGFSVDTNRVHLVEKQLITSLDLMSKADVAQSVMQKVVLLLNSR